MMSFFIAVCCILYKSISMFSEQVLASSTYVVCYGNVLIYLVPIPSIMYGTFTLVWLIFLATVGKYTIHGSYG